MSFLSRASVNPYIHAVCTMVHLLGQPIVKCRAVKTRLDDTLILTSAALTTVNHHITAVTLWEGNIPPFKRSELYFAWLIYLSVLYGWAALALICSPFYPCHFLSVLGLSVPNQMKWICSSCQSVWQPLSSSGYSSVVDAGAVFMNTSEWIWTCPETSCLIWQRFFFSLGQMFFIEFLQLADMNLIFEFWLFTDDEHFSFFI